MNVRVDGVVHRSWLDYPRKWHVGWTSCKMQVRLRTGVKDGLPRAKRTREPVDCMACMGTPTDEQG